MKSTQGFTLIELLVVMAVIALLAAVLLPNLLTARRKANDSTTLSFLRHCVSAMEIKRNQEGFVVAATSCTDPLLGDAAQILPSATTSTTVTTTADLTAYTIEATSSSGHRFKYENGIFSKIP